jgi:phage baseplate assembly protein W
MRRTDYAFPFRIDPVSGQAAQSPYPRHVDEMIRQVLLTSPGERIDLPEFGCGLRQLLFAPNNDTLRATTQLLVQKNLTRWLADQIIVRNVAVTAGADDDESQLLVRIDYTLLETQSLQTTEILVR